MTGPGLTDPVGVTGEDAARADGAATLIEAFLRTAARYPQRVALRTRGGAQELTWSEYAARSTQLAAGFAALGASHADTVGVMLTNRPEFHIVDVALLQLGALPVSIYNTLPVEDVSYVLDHADAHIVVTEVAFEQTVLAAIKRCARSCRVIVVDGDPGRALDLEAVARDASADFEVAAARRAVAPDDTATLIYTSGTTGPPKAVRLTHRGLLAAMQSFSSVAPIPDGAHLISYLPMAHVAERMISHYLPLVGGYTVTCCPEPRRVFEYVAEIRPNWFFAPPRMWQKLMAAIQTATAAGASLPELKHRMGIDRIEVGWVGAAPCPPEVIEFFAAIGLPLCEAWGMSESTGLGTLNVPGQIRPGTVGRPHPGVEVVVAPDGEILVRGAVIMAGYHKDPEKTAEMIDANGWLHTGDIGSIDEDGYLRIIDRKKELIINSAGKNMSPANIEAKLKGASTLIGQACVIGDARPFNVALLVLDPDAMRQIASDGAHEPAADPKVAAALREAVAAANARLSRVEQIKRYRVIDGDWEPGGDELTPTMKLKRKAIADKYQTTIGELYRD